MKWLSIFGAVKWENEILTFSPQSTSNNQSDNPIIPTGYAKSNIPFDNGTIEFEALFKEPNSKCQIVLNYDHESQVYIGLNFMNYPYGIGLFSNNEYKLYKGAGGKIEVDKSYPVKIEVKGSEILLYIDDIIVCSSTANIKKSQLALFFQGENKIEVKKIEINSIQPKAFVIMQFSSEYDELYEEVIMKVCGEFNLEVSRADEMYTQGQIINDITYLIKEASIIIADITPDNPNVYYEVGYAHGIGKSPILVCDKTREKLPFDVSGMRTIFYENKIAGKTKIEKQLREHIKNILKS